MWWCEVDPNEVGIEEKDWILLCDDVRWNLMKWELRKRTGFFMWWCEVDPNEVGIEEKDWIH
jgi:hypothetical protein